MILRSNSNPYRHYAAALFVTAILSLVAMPAFAQPSGPPRAESIKQPRINLSGVSDSGNIRFIVKYRAGGAVGRDPAALGVKLQLAAASYSRSDLALTPQRRIATGGHVVLASRPQKRAESERLMHQIAADPDVEYVEVDRVLEPTLAKNDPLYPKQWALSHPYGIDAEEAWELASGEGVVVAVLDSGITTHSDLNANILPGYDLISSLDKANDGDERDADPNDPGNWVAADACGTTHPARNSTWHGTLMAGVIAAVTNNQKGISGVAHRAKVVPVRISGTCGGWTSDTIDGIVWASGGGLDGIPLNANPAEVISVSQRAGGACSVSMQAAIDDAVFRGSTVVVSAGNDNADVSGFAPANCRNVITVGSVDSTGERSSFSNYGAAVDIAAPGELIMTTSNAGTSTPQAENYQEVSGTSMSTPLVAGLVALIQSAAPTPLPPAEVEALLKRNVTFFPKTPSQPIGPGIVNAGRALQEATRPGFKRSVYQAILF